MGTLRKWKRRYEVRLISGYNVSGPGGSLNILDEILKPSWLLT
jgi:hypothetical protein